MPTIHVYFCADRHEPFPPVESLPSIDAEEPLDAVEALLNSGVVPKERYVSWARVVSVVPEDCRPRQILVVPISAVLRDFNWSEVRFETH